MTDVETIDALSKHFRRSLDKIVTFVSKLALQSEEYVIAQCLSQPVATYNPYSSAHEHILQPLIELIKEAHEAKIRVEQLACDKISSPLQIGQRGKKHPTPPPTMMSITHIRGLYTAIEVLWSWGVEAALAAGSLVAPSGSAIYPKTMIVGSPLMMAVSNAMQTSLPPDTFQSHASTIWSVVLTIEYSVRHLSPRGMMLRRNLPRLVLAAISFQCCSIIDIAPALPPLKLLLPSDLLRNIRQNEDLLMFIEALQHVTRCGRQAPQREAARLLTDILLSTVRISATHPCPALPCTTHMHACTAHIIFTAESAAERGHR